jgi:hypothetical protein
MQNRSPLLITIALVLAALYVSFFTDWFRRPTIQIIVQHRIVPQRGNAARGGQEDAVYPVSFAFDNKYEFKTVKVVAEKDLQTQKFPTPLWYLVSETNSRPTKTIVYGVTPPGMKPAVEDSQPQPLSPEVTYVLQVDTGFMKGSTNFVPKRAAVAER